MASVEVTIGKTYRAGKGGQTGVNVLTGRGSRTLSLTSSGTAAFVQESSTDFVATEYDICRIYSDGKVRVQFDGTAAGSTSTVVYADEQAAFFGLQAGDKISVIDA